MNQSACSNEIALLVGRLGGFIGGCWFCRGRLRAGCVLLGLLVLAGGLNLCLWLGFAGGLLELLQPLSRLAGLS